MERKNFTLQCTLLSFLAITIVLGAVQPAFASLDIVPDGPFTGNVGVSSDGCGTNAPPCSIRQDVFPGATIERAYLYGTSVFLTPPPATITVSLDGTPHTLTALPHNQALTGLESYRADVTTQVDTALGLDSAHVFSADDSTGQTTGTVDGLGLVIVYSDPSLPVSTVLIFDGGQQSSSSTQTLFFGSPVDTSAPFAAEMRLGIGFGFQSSPGGDNVCGTTSPMDSQVDVNGIRLTSCAGNQDDGVAFASTNGELFTIGGVGDDLLNPSDPFQRAADGALPRVNDDERYDITGFITNGDLQLDLTTENTSNDDILFLSILFFNNAIVDTVAPTTFGDFTCWNNIPGTGNTVLIPFGIRDQFGFMQNEEWTQEEYCAATEKNGELSPFSPELNQHYQGWLYPEFTSGPGTGETVLLNVPQFNQIFQTSLGFVDQIFVPANKQLASGPIVESVDVEQHWNCYEITGPAPNNPQVELRTQHGPQFDDVLNPFLMCAPMIKTDPTGAQFGELLDQHMVCYDLRVLDDLSQDLPVFLFDQVTQFNPVPFIIEGVEKLCAPAFKTVIPPQTVGGFDVSINTSALLLAGAASTSMWMIPVVVAGVGIGVFVIKRRN